MEKVKSVEFIQLLEISTYPLEGKFLVAGDFNMLFPQVDGRAVKRFFGD